MALTPEVRPLIRNPSIPAPNDIPPQVGVYYDAAGTPQRAYLPAPAPGATTGTTPASTLAAVTPSDSVALPAGVQALWIGGAGNVALRGTGNGTPVTLSSVPAGTMIRGQFAYVMATGTTATNIVAMI